MTQPVEQSVDAAIAGATVDLEAPAGERVRFEPGDLDAIRGLCGDDATRSQVQEVLRSRLRAAILAMEPDDVAPDWHDAQAAQGLLNEVEGAGESPGRG